MCKFRLYNIVDTESKLLQMTAQFEAKKKEVDHARRELSETKEKCSDQNEQLKLLEMTLKGNSNYSCQLPIGIEPTRYPIERK